MLVDVHFHPTLPEMDPDTTAIMRRAAAAGVAGAIAAGYDLESSHQVVQVAQTTAGVAGAIGIHPWFLTPRNPPLDTLRQLASSPAIVAVGEIGLDGQIETELDFQMDWFDFQLAFAKEAGLPVIIHSRKAVSPTLDMCLHHKGIVGVLHSFGGSPDMARRFLNLGYYISFSGSITRSRVRALRKLVEYVPLERLLLETDAPSIAIEGANGPVEPRHLPLVAQAVAQYRRIPVSELVAQTSANAQRLFGPRLNAAFSLGH